MRVAIVGSGAIGSYYGARLADAGYEVHFLLRSDYEYVAAHGMEVQSVHGDFVLPKISAYRSTDEIGPVELVIVAWKTTSNHLAEQIISPLLGVETKILTLQNGLGNVEHLGVISL